MTTKKPTDVLERLAELCITFKLPTLAEQLGPRFVDAGHGDVLGLVLELFELEAGDRRERRVDRLRRASRLPPGKTLDTLESVAVPEAARGQGERARQGRLPRAL